MSTEKSPRPSGPPPSRWVQDSTLGAGAILILVLFVMVNYLAIRHYQRFDWTSDKIYSLSKKSLAVVEGIDQEIDLVVFVGPDSPVYAPINELLSSYAAANPKLSKREVDPAKNLIEAQRLIQRYNIERDNVVIVATADDRRVIDEFDLAEYDYSGAQMGQPPTISEFKGEQQVTSALLALVEAKKPKVLFTTGHGEVALERGDARSLSQAQGLLGGDNFQIETWGSLGETEVPPDTDLIVVAGPTTGFLPPELDLLSSYLDSGGRLMLLLDPVFAAGTGDMVDLGLTDWLAGYGVEIRGDVVIDPSRQMPFFGPETVYTDSYGSHPVVDALEQRRTPVLLPLARSVSKSDDAPDGYQIVELLKTSEAGWGETNLDSLEEKIEAGEDDTPGPVSLAVAVSFEIEDATEPPVLETESEEGRSATGEGEDELVEELPTLGDEGEDGDEDGEALEARMVVVGDVDFAGDMGLASGDNAVLLLNAFNWLIKREELIDIEGRKPAQTTFTLSRAELSQVYLLVLLVLPGLAVAFGVWIYLRRRR